jgi:hypoxanthine phosphoribosyltransferase
MSLVQIHDKQFAPYISKEAIQKRIAEMAKEIEADYKGLNPLFICVLNGAFIFAADLYRAISIPAEISFVKLSSYEGMVSTGTVVTAIGINGQIHGRHVILLEDIIDTGKTLDAFIPQLLEQKPASLKLACLLSKPDALQYDVTTDYTGFVIPDYFVVGYGLDYNGLGRNLPDIYTLADQ